MAWVRILKPTICLNERFVVYPKAPNAAMKMSMSTLVRRSRGFEALALTTA